MENSIFLQSYKNKFSLILESKFYPFLVILAACFMVVMPWHIINNRLPIWDEAAYVITTLDIASALNHSLIDGLVEAYIKRGWRPIIFPVYASPFFFAVKNNIKFGIALTDLFATIVLSFYSYKICRLYIDGNRSLLAVLFIISTDWLLNFSHKFFSELAWISLTSIFIFHYLLIIRNDIDKLENSIICGIIIGFMICIRPAESILITFLPLCHISMIGPNEDFKYTKLDLRLLFCLFIYWASSIYLSIFLNIKLSAKLVVVFIMSISIIVFFKNRILEKPIFKILLLSSTISIIWFIPKMKELYDWMYETSFGPLSKLPYGNANGSFMTILSNISQFYNVNLIFFIICIILIFLLCDKIKILLDVYRLGNYHSKAVIPIEYAKPNSCIMVFNTGILMIVPMLTMLILSNTADMRRLMPSMYVIEMGLIIFYLSHSGFLEKIRLGLLTIIVLFQFILCFANSLGFSKYNYYFSASWVPSESQPDPNSLLLNAITSKLDNNTNVAFYSLCYRDPVVGCSRRNLDVFEVEALTALSHSRELGNTFNFARDLDLSNINDLSGQLKSRGYQYLLIDKFNLSDRDVMEDPAYSQTKAMIEIPSDHFDSNVVFVEKFVVHGRDLYLYKIY